MAAADRPTTAVRRGGMGARLLWRALLVRRSRVLAAVTAIAVGAAVIAALASLYFDISAKMSRELRAYGANFIVAPASAEGDKTFSEATYRKLIAELPADRLVGASPFLYGVARVEDREAVIAGLDFAGAQKISPYWQVEGNWIGVDFDERRCMLGERLAESLGLHPGDTIEVSNDDGSFKTELTVRGIVETGEAEDDQILVNRSLAQKLLGMPNVINLAMLSIQAEGEEADRLASTVEADFPGLDIRPIRQVSQSDGELLDKIKVLMAFVAGIILVITAVCVNSTLTAMIVERRREIGLQKALGADDSAIMRQFLIETVTLSLIGVAAGLVIGFGLAQLLGQAVFSTAISFRAIVVPATLAISLVAALAAAIVPIRRAIRIVPAQVLKGE
ncbi:ABC transporter permease [Afifella sp. JA880]|uniref:ABC transporter permease n=1 Tax=Afifella sp. JA880 TaxID=2975280 RepID=UPI0021BB53F1|nr:FtsX-like permease family protein [Afifella sp. JA880]MCT8267680.1 ABC transporter permease [Afifella sp. JA880]